MTSAPFAANVSVIEQSVVSSCTSYNMKMSKAEHKKRAMNLLAMAFPIPPDEPVISAVLPRRLNAPDELIIVIAVEVEDVGVTLEEV